MKKNENEVSDLYCKLINSYNFNSCCYYMVPKDKQQNIVGIANKKERTRMIFKQRFDQTLSLLEKE